MSKVKIQGHASGTGVLTVTAPNTDTDRTITLPDGSGTLAFTTGDDDKLPLAGGTMTGNVNLGDNVKAQFGTGNDLQIYHDGSNSYIRDAGTGDIHIRSDAGFRVQNAGGTENYLYAESNGKVRLYYDNNTKLDTTSNGIDVTGTVTSDGLIVSQNAADDFSARITNSNATSGHGALLTGGVDSGSYFSLKVRNVGEQTVFGVMGDGDNIFYNSSGTEKMRWDASAESLGIGTSSPDSSLEIYKASTAELMIGSDNGGTAQISLYENNSTTKEATIKYDGSANNLVIGTSGEANAIVIPRDSGNLGLGTASPSAQLHLKQTSGDQFLKMEGATTNWGWRNQSDGTHGLYDFTNSRWLYLGNNSYWSVQTGGSEKFKIMSDGRGLSQFTAKAWVAWNQTGTIAIRDSHNVSSMSDYGTGEAKINLTNNMATADSYAVSALAAKASGAPSGTNSTFTTIGESLPVTGPVIGMIYNGSASDRPYASAIIFGD